MMMNNPKSKPEPEPEPELPPRAIVAGSRINELLEKLILNRFGVSPSPGTDQATLAVIKGFAALVDAETQYSNLLDLLCMIRDGLAARTIVSNPIRGETDEGAAKIIVVRSLESLITEVLLEHGR